MGYIREPKNVDLVVGPSTFTEETKKRVAKAISQYKKTGQKPQSVQFVAQGSVMVATHVGRPQSANAQPAPLRRRKAKA